MNTNENGFEILQTLLHNLLQQNSFTLNLNTEVSALMGVIKVPLKASMVVLNAAETIYMNADVTVLNNGFQGSYFNENGKVSQTLNGKTDTYGADPIDINAIAESLIAYLRNYSEELTQTNTELSILLKENAVLSILAAFGMDTTMISNYLKDIKLSALVLHYTDYLPESLTTSLSANLENIPLTVPINIQICQINSSTLPKIN